MLGDVALAVDDRGEPEHRVRGALHVHLEVGLHAEQLPEVRVHPEQVGVQPRVADDHDLRLNRRGRGAQSGGRSDADRLRARLRHQLAGAERALQALVRRGILQQVAHAQHQVAAACEGERAGADHRVVRDRRAELPDVLDAAEQVPEVGVGLADHRRAAVRVVADEGVDLVAAQQRGPLLRRPRQARRLRGRSGCPPDGASRKRPRSRCMSAQTASMKLQRLLLFAPALAQRLEEVLDREARDLLVELFEAFLRLPLEAAHRQQRVLDERLQLLARAGLDLLALLSGERGDRLVARGLALDDRCGGDAAGGQLQREAELRGLLLQLLEHRGAAQLLLLQHRGALADVGVAVERLAQLRARVLHGGRASPRRRRAPRRPRARCRRGGRGPRSCGRRPSPAGAGAIPRSAAGRSR